MNYESLSLDELIKIVGKIPGWIEPEEAFMLYELSRDWPGDGRTVELGSYQGRSTVCLALGLKARNRRDLRLLSIDTHRGSKEHQPGKPYFEASALNPETGQIDTFPAFLSNLKAYNLSEWVEPWRCTTIEAASIFSGAIRLLFVDADHNEAAVQRDSQLWLPHLEPNGLIVLHDVGEWSGPTLIAEELQDKEGFYPARQRGSTLALTRGSRK